MIGSFSARRVLLAAFFIAVLAPSARAQETELVGTLHAVWHDPAAGGPAVRAHSITDDAGRSFEIVLTEAMAAPFGGLDELRLRRIRVAVRDGRVVSIVGVEPRTEPSAARLMVEGPRVMRYITLLCRFPDFADVNPGTVADAERVFGATYPGAQHYWDEISNGQLSLAGSEVKGWYMMPQGRDVYVPGDFANLTAVGRDCAAAADADVDFSQFDGVNFVFNTNLDCCSYGGTGSLTLDGGPRGYAMTWLSSSVFRNAGTVSHEIGHSLGLSHSSGSYGLVYDSHWDVMSAGDWYIAAPGPLYAGSHVNAFGKRQLGFIPASRDFLATPGVHEILIESTALPADNANYLVARIPTPRFGSGQYYTIEARGMAGYDAPLHGAGIIVHRIGGGGATPSNVVDRDGDFDPNDDGALIKAGDQFFDAVNDVRVSVLERVGNAFRVRLEVGAIPLVTIATPQRRVDILGGTDTTLVDSAAVTITGVPAGSAWTARKLQGGPVEVVSTNGVGDGLLRWRVVVTGLAPCTYDQDIRVDVGTQAYAVIRVRLVVQTPPALNMGVYAPVVRDSLFAGASRLFFNGVSLTGAGNDTTTWQLSSTAPWITVESPIDTGSGTLRYTRSAAGLEPGMYVATLTLRAPGTTLPDITLLDSLRVLEPLSWRVTHRGLPRTVLAQGAIPVLDSVRVELDGRFGTGAVWYALQGTGTNYIVPEFPGPIGTGWMRFRRAPRDLAPGGYVGTIRVYLAMDPTQEIFLDDTLIVTAAPVGIALNTRVTRDTVRGMTSFSEDSVFVQPTGPSSSTRRWRATSMRALLAFPLSGGQIPNEGMGPGWLRFIRNTADRAPGWHVDTLDFLERDGSVVLAKLIDSLYVTAGPVPATIAVTAQTRRNALRAGAVTQLADSVDVTSAGDDAHALSWTATTAAPWITVQTISATGNARLRWSRSAAALAPGWHVDTILVYAASNGASARVIDSLYAWAPLAVSATTARPAAVMGAAYTDALTSTGGPGSAATWQIIDGALPAGVTLNAATAALSGIPEASGDFAFTARAIAGSDTATKAFTLSVTEPTLLAPDVMQQLLGAAALTEAQRRYLDLQGNKNGRLDIGDVRAWRRRQAPTVVQPTVSSSLDAKPAEAKP